MCLWRFLNERTLTFSRNEELFNVTDRVIMSARRLEVIFVHRSQALGVNIRSQFSLCAESSMDLASFRF
jgi:hypothetical protein